MCSFIRKRSCVPLNSIALLVCIWLVGLLSGTLIFFFGLPHFASTLTMVCSVFFAEKRNLLFTILPFLLSALAVSFRRPSWLFLVCWIKATLVSFTYSLLCLYYGQAGWLVRWFLYFVDVCSMPLLFFYWLRNLSPSRTSVWYEYVIYCLALIIFMLLDYRFIAPYAVKIGII